MFPYISEEKTTCKFSYSCTCIKKERLHSQAVKKKNLKHENLAEGF